MKKIQLDISNQNEALTGFVVPQAKSNGLQEFRLISNQNSFTTFTNLNYYCRKTDTTNIQVTALMLEIDGSCKVAETDITEQLKSLKSCEKLKNLQIFIGCYEPKDYSALAELNQYVSLDSLQYSDKKTGNKFECQLGSEKYISVYSGKLSCVDCNFQCTQCYESDQAQVMCKKDFCYPQRQYNDGYCDLIPPSFSEGSITFNYPEQKLTALWLNRLFEKYMGPYC